MKKNPGRKQRRQNQRKDAQELKLKMKIATQPEKEYREPHPNAIKVNEIKEARLNEAFDKKETLDMIFRQETKLGKEMLKEQEARLKRRDKWLKKAGLAV